MDVVVFLVFAFVALACAINVVTQRHPIASAVSLIGVMGSLAVLYLLLGGEFIAAAQVIVYAGAIMVLFVFVIMLLNAGVEARRGRSVVARSAWHSLVGGFPDDAGLLCGAHVSARGQGALRRLYARRPERYWEGLIYALICCRSR